MASIVIVEDNLMLADMTEEALVAFGYDVCGIARTVVDAVASVRHHNPDLLLLDYRLADGELGTDVAAELRSFGGLGILYATANLCKARLTSVDGHACLVKPYRPNDLKRALEVVLGLVATGKAPTPFPNGFHLLGPDAGEAGGENAERTGNVPHLTSTTTHDSAWRLYELPSGRTHADWRVPDPPPARAN